MEEEKKTNGGPVLPQEDPHVEEDTRVDVRAIVEEIRAQLRAEGAADDLPRFEEIPFAGSEGVPVLGDAFSVAFGRMCEECRVAYYREAGGGLKGKLRRFIRRGVKPVVYPIVEDQNTQNANVAEAMRALAEIVAQQQVRIAVLERALAEKERPAADKADRENGVRE